MTHGDASRAATPLQRHVQRMVERVPQLLRAMHERLSLDTAASSGLERLDQADRLAVTAVWERADLWQQPVQAALASSIRSSLLKPQPVLTTAAVEASALEAVNLDDLRLKDDHEIELDMETARFEQQLESAAERPLRELRALCSTLRGDTAVKPDSPPLHPKACAAALAEGVNQLALSPAARVACLQRLAAAAVKPVLAFYDEQVRTLVEEGVQPADFRVVPGPQVRAPATGPATPSDLPPMAAEARIGAALERLVLHARAEVGLSQLQHGQAAGHPGRTAAGAQVPADELPADLADRLMGELLRSLARHEGVTVPTQTLFDRLEAPGQRLARQDPDIWFKSGHPWWLLLDRLLSLCEVLADGPEGGQVALLQRFDPTLRRLGEAMVPDAALCQAALDELETQSSVGLATSGDVEEASPEAPSEDESPTLAGVLREQMSLQLRSSTAPAGLRRFLLGPWVEVLVKAMNGKTDESAMQRYSGLVDELLALLVASPDASAPPDDRRRKLLTQVRAGLETLDMPADQVEGWLADLTTRLTDASAAAFSGSDQDEGWRHEDLPTVPVGLHDALQTARARRDREAWLVNLQVGDICRLFLDGRWQTLRLTDIHKPSQRYVMQGRERDGRPQTLTRQALEQLRSEGLATTIEPGAFLTKAVETLNASLRPLGRLRGSGPGPGGRKP